MMNTMNTINTMNATVLFVDDEPAILDVLSRTFKNDIANILTCEFPLKALEILKSTHVDLVVLDLRMPGKDGLTLYKEMKEICPDLGVIFLTAHGDKESVQEALRLGADNFVDKPYEKNYLKLVVRKALEQLRYEALIKEILELFIYHYTDADPSAFKGMGYDEKEKTIRAALGVAKLKIGRKKNAS